MQQEMKRVARLTVFKGRFKGAEFALSLTDLGATSSSPEYASASYDWEVDHEQGRKCLMIEVRHNTNADAPALQAAILVSLVLAAKGSDDFTVDRIGKVAKAAYKLDEHDIAAAADHYAAQHRVADSLRAQV
jgi:hypothetical protein